MARGHTSDTKWKRGGSIESAPMGMQSLQPLSTLGGDNSSSRLSEISDTPSKEDITPVLHLEQFRQIQNENFDLRQQMRNYQSLLASHEQLQGQLKASMELTEKIQSENELLKMEINRIDVGGNNSSSAPNEYETENLILHQKLTDQVCEMNKMMSERDSLVATLKLLQDDLMASEKRHRSRTTVS